MPRAPKPAPPKRRRRGTGSVAKQADGSFWAIPPPWLDAGRKPRRGFPSREAASAWLADVCARARAGQELPADLSFGDYAAVWFDRTADSSDWAPSTRATTLVRLRLLAPLRDVLLADLRPGRVQDVIAGLVRRGVSAAVVGQVASIARRVMAAAQEDGLVSRNVAARLTLPKVRRPAPRAWTRAEVGRLLAAVEGEPLEPLVWLGLLLGLRIGELLALDWDVVDLGRRLLLVRASYSAGRLGPTKGRREREVRLPERLWAILLRHHERQPLGTRWLFPSPQTHGRPRSYPSARAWLLRMVGRAGIRDLGSHALRHSAASAMLNSGVSAAEVARQLGHAHAGVTMASYWSPTRDGADPADVVAGWLDGDDSEL